MILLDECSQMTEPASLLPIARFQCEKLVLVGDPKVKKHCPSTSCTTKQSSLIIDRITTKLFSYWHYLSIVLSRNFGIKRYSIYSLVSTEVLTRPSSPSRHCTYRNHFNPPGDIPEQLAAYSAHTLSTALFMLGTHFAAG